MNIEPVQFNPDEGIPYVFASDEELNPDTQTGLGLAIDKAISTLNGTNRSIEEEVIKIEIVDD